MIYQRKVSKQTALNPVARSVARAKLAGELLNFKLKVYSLQRGDPTDAMEELGPWLSLIGYAAELDKRIPQDDPRKRIIRGAVSACNQAIAAGTWDEMLAPAISHGLTVAEDLNKALDPVATNTAFHRLMQK